MTEKALKRELSGAKPPPTTTNNTTPQLRYNLYLLLLVGLNAITFAPQSHLKAYISQAAAAALGPVWKKVLTDAYFASLCWGTTYLFVRRIWNPENFPVHSALSKFVADSIYGGLAAGASVIMRHFLSQMM